MATKAQQKQQEKEQAIARLREIIKPGMTVQTLLRRVAPSGMSRCLDVMITGADGLSYITHDVGIAIGASFSREGWIRVGGCGMDAGFQTVYELGYALFPKGFECIGKGEQPRDHCPSCDHSNGDRDYTPHHHDSGGYAIRHSWV